MARFERFTTGVGRFVYPHLTKAQDYKGNGKFAYDTKFELEGDAAAQLKQLIDDAIDAQAKKANVPAAVSKPYTEHAEKPGVTVFKFKVVATMETKNGTWDRKPALFLRDGSAVDPETFVGGGSVGQISFTVYAWDTPAVGAGVTLQPVACIFDELVEGGGRGESAEDYGFKTTGRPAQADAPAAPAARGADF